MRKNRALDHIGIYIIRVTIKLFKLRDVYQSICNEKDINRRNTIYTIAVSEMSEGFVHFANGSRRDPTFVVAVRTRISRDKIIIYKFHSKKAMKRIYTRSATLIASLNTPANAKIVYFAKYRGPFSSPTCLSSHKPRQFFCQT